MSSQPDQSSTEAPEPLKYENLTPEFIKGEMPLFNEFLALVRSTDGSTNDLSRISISFEISMRNIRRYANWGETKVTSKKMIEAFSKFFISNEIDKVKHISKVYSELTSIRNLILEKQKEN